VLGATIKQWRDEGSVVLRYWDWSVRHNGLSFSIRIGLAVLAVLYHGSRAVRATGIKLCYTMEMGLASWDVRPGAATRWGLGLVGIGLCNTI
jgi:hypothetical protein